jgi:hypothetical protein
MRRFFQLCLLGFILTGMFLAWRTGQQRSAARSEYERLARLTGDLSLTDPNQLHVLALETGEPLHFAWRIYLPPRCRITVKHDGGSSSSGYSDAQHLIARVRFREHPPGRLQIYTRFGGGSSQMGFGDESLSGFLRGKWDQVRVEQLGEGQTALVELGKEAVLLRLMLPDELVAQASQEIDLRRQPVKFPLLYELRFLPQTQP